MWFAGGKKLSLTTSAMAAGIMMLVVFMLVSQSVRAIRPFPGDDDDKNAANNATAAKETDDNLFAKYFNNLNATSLQFNTSSSTLDDSKRRVPSCPDPLHNK